MPRSKSIDILDFPPYFKLDTSADMADVSKSYAYMKKSIQEIGSIAKMLKAGVDEDKEDKLVGELAVRVRGVAMDADDAISVLLDAKRKISRYLRQFD